MPFTRACLRERVRTRRWQVDRRLTVVALGEITVDWLSLEPGRTIFNASNFYRYPGGNTANVAIGLARLGVTVSLVAKIGTDFHGAYLKETLAAEGVKINGLIEDARYPTAQCYMTVGADGSHQYRNWPKPHAADMLCAEDITEPLLDGAKIMHSTGISLVQAPRREAVLRAMELCLERDVIVSFDACFPTGQAAAAKDAAMLMMSKAHIVKMNLDELSFWSGANLETDINEMVESVKSRINPIVLIVTLGNQGALLYTATDKIFCPACQVDSICDVGAGDAFMAGLIFGVLPGLRAGNVASLERLQNRQWLSAAKTGAACGARCTLAIGATESFPRIGDLSALVATE